VQRFIARQDPDLFPVSPNHANAWNANLKIAAISFFGSGGDTFFLPAN
jgi:hypothetical protein